MPTHISEADWPVLKLLAAERPLIIGHRGFSQLAPENTLPSFELAIAAGADMVELDFRQSKDGHLIVIHDAELDRTTDAARRWRKRHIKVESRTVAEIQSLDAGSWFDPSFAGTRIPTLAEALDTIQGRSIALLERKAGGPAEVLALLREKKLLGRVVILSFDWALVRSLHELEARPLLGALGPPTALPDGSKPRWKEKRLGADSLAQLRKTGAKAAVWNRKISKAGVQLAHEQGLKVWVYTVNDARLANRLLDLGVDGIITNDPALIGKIVAKRRSS